MPFTFPACRCCGYLTRTMELGGDLCEVCGWLELPDEGRAAWAWMTLQLEQSIQNFETLGAVSEDYVSSVRPPREAEVPPGGRHPWAVRRAKLVESVLAQIYEAFAQVKLGRGIGLHDARVLDDYWGAKPPQDYLDALPKDMAGHWRNTLPDLLELYSEFFCFTNAEGFRYYLPAYLTASLRSLLEGPKFGHWQVVYALASPRNDLFDALSLTQREAVAAYLHTGKLLLDEHDTELCAEALRGYWGKYLRSVRA